MAANGNGKHPPSNGTRRAKPRAGTRPPLVPQPNGRGALYVGGVPGNAGGGRPTNDARKRLGEIVNARYSIIADIADGVVRYALTKSCEHCGEAPSGKGRR